MAEGNHSFTEQDIRKRFGAIVGHTVTEVDTAGVLTASAASRNKGRIGAVIEQSVLGYPADSDRRPDIVIDGQPWEVKATGLKESARGGWCAKEPMSITAVAPEGIVTESFSTSAFWHKAERLHGRGCRAGIAATRCATAFGTTAGPAVHRVADKVELVADGTGDLRSREYHHQTDDSRDQYVLDD